MLIFHDGYDLPEFAAYPLLGTEEGREHLSHVAEIAKAWKG